MQQMTNDVDEVKHLLSPNLISFDYDAWEVSPVACTVVMQRARDRDKPLIWHTVTYMISADGA